MQKRMLSFISVFVAIAVACSVFFVGLCAQPASAEALDTAKCTARPNADGSNEVKGATETRITWEGQAAADESVKGITLTMPEGTSFSTKNARITMLSGSDLMTRTNIAANFQIQGDSIVATFDEAAPAGGYFRFEVYEVKFPASGGAMDLTGTYELANGDYKDIGQIPAINVVGIDPAEELSTYLGEQDWVQAWNSNKFLHLFLDPTVLVTSFPVVIKGFFMALAIVLVAFPCAIPFGLLLALMRMSKLRVLRGLATTYVNVVRGTPLFLQIYIAFFGLPLAGIQVPPFPLGVVVLAMNSSAYLCEIFRAGIQSIPKGQFEASRSLGMNGAQAVFHAQRAVSVIPMHKLRIGILRRIALHVQRAVQLLPHVLSAFHAQQAEIVLHGQGHIPADAAGRAAHAGLAMKIRIIVWHQIFMRVSHRNPSFSRNDGIIRARESAVTHRFRKKMINLFVFNAIYGIT